MTIGLVTGNSQPDPKNVACQVDVKEDRTVEVKSVNKGTIKQHPIDPTKIDGKYLHWFLLWVISGTDIDKTRLTTPQIC